MKELTIIDTGYMWGYPVAKIFQPWPGELYEPKNHEEFFDLLDCTNPDLILFGGGADVDPTLYGHPNLAAGVGHASLYRDHVESLFWNLAQEKKIPTLGICRGAQFTCAMSGGELIQDCDHHAIVGTHHIITKDEKVLEITSTHHQMMYPWPTEHELLAWTPKRSGKYVYAGKEFDLTKMVKEPEIVYFPKTRALAVQGHPEYMDVNSPAAVYVRSLVRQYLLNGRLI